MRRNTLNYIIDAATAVVMLGLLATGVLMRFVLPPGSGTRVLWGLSRHDWGDVHFWISVAAVAIGAVHVALHWNWVCTVTWRMIHPGAANAGVARRWVVNAWGAGLSLLLVVLVVGMVWIARQNVQPTGGRGRSQATDASNESQPQGGNLVRGSMTLAEASRAAGIPVETLRSELNLPQSVLPDERLGRIVQQYGLSMSQVRSVVESHLD